MDEYPPADTAPGLDIGRLLQLSVSWLLADPDRERFLRRMAEEGPRLFAELLTDDSALVQREPTAHIRRADAAQFFRSLAWVIASTVPLPGDDWQPRRLPLPGRNDPCLCGSLKKYKHCCAPLMQRAPRLDAEFIAALVVQALPARDWAALPASRVPRQAVLMAAHELREQGQLRDAMRLLEPWAKLPPPWRADQADLLDLLADLYLDLGHPRKRRALADAMVAKGDATVQSLGWQRRSMMASDAGDPAAAQQAFERAQRLTPNDPRVALLEVTTLVGTGELDRAHERAAFHVRRLERLPQAAQLEREIEALQAIARGEFDHLHPDAGSDDADDSDEEDEDGEGLQALDAVFDALNQWLSQQRPPRLRLDLSGASASDLGELRLARPQARALQAWRAACTPGGAQPGEGVVELDARWLQLQAHPPLLDCFEVLAEMIGFLDAVPFGLAVPAQALLLARALALWTQLRERYPQARCEWGWLENRPALRLLGRHVSLDASPRADTSFEWLRALVEVLNPTDNQGLRQRLCAVLLRRGDAAAALALAERYPDDFVGMQLLHALALLASSRMPEAEAILAAALKVQPHVEKLLLAARAPRVPDVDSYRVGSVEEARIAVAGQHDLWREPAVRAWLRRRQAPDGPLQLTLT